MKRKTRWFVFARVVALTFALAVTAESLAALEIKTSFLPSAALVGRTDVIFSSHSTVMLGAGWFHAGAYGGFATISQNVQDLSYGGAIRFGETIFVELQGGYFERTFTQNSKQLQGKGVAANLILGTVFNEYFGVDVRLSAKRIDSGMDKRTILDLLPFLSLRWEI